MAFTGTYARTRSYTRIDLIVMQIRIALRRTTNIQSGNLNAIQEGINNQWIQKVSVYGFDNRELCRAELILEIDWNEYNDFMSVGKATVAIDEKWIDDTAIEVEEAVNLFNEFVNRNHLKTEWRVWYVSGVDINKIDYKLGFVPSKPIKWASSTNNRVFSIPEIPELHVGLFMLD